MNSPVVVNLWGERVGALLWDATGGYASFEYDKEFVKSGLEISPLLTLFHTKSINSRILKIQKLFKVCQVS